MPLVSIGWNAVVLVLCLTGFFFLVLANAREGRRLLRRPAGRGERRVCAAAGSVLLFLALWVCVEEWRGNFGPVLWFGWLTVAALVLIFTLAGAGDGRQRTGNRKAGGGAAAFGTDAGAVGCPPVGAAPLAVTRKRFLKRGGPWGVFFLLPGLFLVSVWRADPWPVLREDAVRGQAGPWAFTLAETERAAPKLGGSGVAMKEFTLRFADAALPEIRAAYLQARQPRSLRAAGVAFEGNYLRTATIAIPPALQAEEGIWLIVEGRNGEVHHAAVDIARLSPALSRFLAGEEAALENDEGWDATLSCWHEAEEVACRGGASGMAPTGHGRDGYRSLRRQRGSFPFHAPEPQGPNPLSPARRGVSRTAGGKAGADGGTRWAGRGGDGREAEGNGTMTRGRLSPRPRSPGFFHAASQESGREP